MARTLITGGCGFVGCNLAHQLIKEGEEVVLLDNLSRKGTEKNLAWLQEKHGGKFRFLRSDIRDYAALKKAVQDGCEKIFHLAGQVAVTTSVIDPRSDFEVNALGTFNLLEAVRETGIDPVLLFTSTNKVYGGMEDVAVDQVNGRYVYRDFPEGIAEDRNLDFHSPYGCSKGAADQYVRDYSRIYGLRSVVFRMSCQYGPHQQGNEDQGWVAHFVIASHFKRDINIYGDGKQVRDVLFIEDLLQAFKLAAASIDQSKGKVFNIGGGAKNTFSILELIALLEELTGRNIKVHFHPWRPGDQPVFVSDTRRAEEVFGWKPAITREDGVRRLYDWVRNNGKLLGG